MRRTYKHNVGIIHCIAECSVCDWREAHYRKAARAASKHARDTLHTVRVDVGSMYDVSPTGGRA